ncbi:MAG TPA: hydrogenase maturation nickel metallochaperone HypA [Clostridia bacterium]
MHEYSVTKSMLDTVLDEAQKAGASKIIEIKLVIGDLSSIVAESVQLMFELLSENTAAEGARLHFKRVPALFKCKDCNLEYEKPRIGFSCPSCGKEGMPTGAGREFYIESIEVD